MADEHPPDQTVVSLEREFPFVSFDREPMRREDHAWMAILGFVGALGTAAVMDGLLAIGAVGFFSFLAGSASQSWLVHDDLYDTPEVDDVE